MTNNIAVVPTNPVEINKAFGFESSNKPALPTLKVNGADAEDDKPSAPKGSFVYDDGERLLHASEVTIRTFTKGLQYRLYHPKDKTKNDVSIIAPSFRAEFRSTSGRIACGKMSKQKYLELGDNVSPMQKELQDNVKCKLLIFGLVSGKFKSVDTGDEVELENELFMWTTSQSSFMVMDRAITGIEKERRAVPCTPIKIKLKKEKTGSVTFFVPLPEVLGDTVSFNAEREMPLLDKIKKYVVDTNRFVESKYNEALKGKSLDKDFASVGQIIDNMSPNDEIPF